MGCAVRNQKGRSLGRRRVTPVVRARASGAEWQLMNTSHAQRQVPDRRRWLRYSLRTLLLLTTGLAVWLGYASEQARRQRKAGEVLTLLAADICYDEDLGVWDEPYYHFSLGDAYYQATGRCWGHRGDDAPWAPRWLLDAIGQDYFRTIVAVQLEQDDSCPTALNGDDLRAISALGSLRCLALDGAVQLGDVDAPQLARLRRLERLFLKDWRITDDGLAHLAGLTRLRYLSLAGTKISDDGLVHLRRLKNLEMLELCDTNISDAGLKHLQGLPRLSFLYVRGTKVTEDGVRELNAVSPRCCVVVVVPPATIG
jgi:hypothetical protein